MRHHIFVLALASGLITAPAIASEQGPRRDSLVQPDKPVLCRLFEQAYWDNQGFTVNCDKRPERNIVSTKRCPMFTPPVWDNAGFTVPCESARSEVAAAPQPRSCPMFTPPTWDNMGFRVPC